MDFFYTLLNVVLCVILLFIGFCDSKETIRMISELVSRFNISIAVILMFVVIVNILPKFAFKRNI